MIERTSLTSTLESSHETPVRSSRTLVLVLSIAVSAVLLRAFIYLVFEQLAFDSDQAINGLMAKHLIEGRAFPLFYYGQTYMLAVEAWVAAPFFLVLGPTVTALRISLLVWNIVFVCLLMTTLHRHTGLEPRLALTASLFFLIPPTPIASMLMNAQGGIVEPYVYVIALWLLRTRPLWFGVVLGIGFRNREFVAYAVPAALAVDWLTGRLDRARVRQWLEAGVTFAAVWQLVEALKPAADLMGPGTRGQLLAGFSGSQFTNLRDRFDFSAVALPDRIFDMGPQLLGWLAGAQQFSPAIAIGNHPWLTAAAAIYLTALAGRLFVHLVRPERELHGVAWTRTVAARAAKVDFPLYLTAVGVLAVVLFVAGKPVLAGYSRYALLGLIVPTGLLGALLAIEQIAAIRVLAAGLAITWAAIMAMDHLALAARNIRSPEIDANRLVANALVSEGITTATAGYWRAYAITFVARERLRVASTDFVRIQEYQDEFTENVDRAVAISEQPCPDGHRVGVLYVCKP